MFVVWRIAGKSRLRIVTISIVVAAIAVPILSVGPISTLVTNKFATISNVQNDHSAQQRTALYESFFITAVSRSIGNGFGSLGVAAKLTACQNADFDSGLLDVPFTFGCFGFLICL